MVRLQFKEEFIKDSTGHLLCPCSSIKWDVDIDKLVVRCLECSNELELIGTYDKNNKVNKSDNSRKD